jgi:hydroxymethylpyrimidine pyrophosphatase-like HAD family hydrolase
MIQLFITDIDGCLMKPMEIPRWDILTEIRSLNEQSKHDSTIPSLTLCTGRPMPYAEAVAQIMGIEQPIVFESAGVFDPVHYRFHLNKTFTDEASGQISALKEWLTKQIINKHEGFTLEFSKLMDAGIIHRDQAMIQQVLPSIRKYVGTKYGDFEVHHTDVSVNIILKNNNKKAGIQKLCEINEITPSEIAYIGDSSGDISGLTISGHPFSPSNATEDVKNISRTMPSENSEAVLAAYQEVIEHNRG